MTLPIMCVFMTAAALCNLISNDDVKVWAVVVFLFLFAAAYSPESGCAFAIAVNLLFAGLLSIFFPGIISGLGNGGALGLFAGSLNLVAFVLVFLLVEETKRRSLEDLDLVFAVPKRAFIRYQLFQYLPWFWRRYTMCNKAEDKPSLYIDMIWGSVSDSSGTAAAGEKTLQLSPEEEPGGPKDQTVEARERGEEGDGESVDSLHA